MASTALLSSKVVVLEEQPAIPAITALPSAVLLCVGITERGPIGDPVLVTSFDEYVATFGGYTASGQVAPAMQQFFAAGGSFAWVVRTCHYTDITDPTSFTAVVSTRNLSNAGAAATPASVGPSDAGPFVADPNDEFHIKVGGVHDVATFTATAASITEAATWPIAATAGTESMGVTVAGVNGGLEQTVVIAAGLTLAAEVAADLNGKLVGVNAVVDTGHVKLTTDQFGSGASLQITTGGTLNAILSFPTADTNGTGNVANIKAITPAEVEAVLEAALAGTAVTVNGGSTITITTTATGPAASLQVEGTGDIDFGFDTDLHEGATTAPQPTLTIDGKTPGIYGDAITIRISAASNGAAASFNMAVLKSGLVQETFPNLTMDDTSVDYVETRVNHLDFGSQLITVTDLGLVLTPTQKRPVNGTSSALSGGNDGLAALADSDYLGSSAGPTGLSCFDRVTNGTLLIAPGVTSQAVHLGLCDYAEVTRNGSMFVILDPAAAQTAQQMVTYVTGSGLSEYSEYGAIYWPRIKIANPSTTIYGTDNAITVPPSGAIAGRMAANDQKLGGVYESPAGYMDNYGVLRGILGVEDDPAGGSIHPVMDANVRDLVYPYRINPIRKGDSTPWYIDGGRTLKSTGNFPNVGERRGVIFIENALRVGLDILRHRFNNRTTRRTAHLIILSFLKREMAKGAFRSTVPSDAFFIDTSDQLNPLVNEMAGIMTIRVGLATNKPTEFVVLLVTQDTRALQEQLAA
jgi:hypothetical protein